MLPFLKERESLNKRNGKWDKGKDVNKLGKGPNQKSQAPDVDLEVAGKIEKEILSVLGTPLYFWKTEVRLVAPKTYRANIVILKKSKRDMIPRITRPHSYFVATASGSDGVTNTFSFNPVLKNVYDQDGNKIDAAQPTA
jgi:hypothetical protein